MPGSDRALDHQHGWCWQAFDCLDNILCTVMWLNAPQFNDITSCVCVWMCENNWTVLLSCVFIFCQISPKRIKPVPCCWSFSFVGRQLTTCWRAGGKCVCTSCTIVLIAHLFIDFPWECFQNSYYPTPWSNSVIMLTNKLHSGPVSTVISRHWRRMVALTNNNIIHCIIDFLFTLISTTILLSRVHYWPGL